MSVVIAMRYKNGMILAADRQASYGNLKLDNVTKVKSSQYSDTAMGAAGDIRDADIIFSNMIDLMSYKDVLDEVTLDKSYVVLNIVDNMFNLLSRNRRTKLESDDVFAVNSEYVVISTNSIFRIFSDGAVLECNDFCSIGSGSQLVKGYIDGLKLDYSKLTEAQALFHLAMAISKSCEDERNVDNFMDVVLIDELHGKVEFSRECEDFL